MIDRVSVTDNCQSRVSPPNSPELFVSLCRGALVRKRLLAFISLGQSLRTWSNLNPSSIHFKFLTPLQIYCTSVNANEVRVLSIPWARVPTHSPSSKLSLHSVFVPILCVVCKFGPSAHHTICEVGEDSRMGGVTERGMADIKEEINKRGKYPTWG